MTFFDRVSSKVFHTQDTSFRLCNQARRKIAWDGSQIQEGNLMDSRLKIASLIITLATPAAAPPLTPSHLWLRPPTQTIPIDASAAGFRPMDARVSFSVPEIWNPMPDLDDPVQAGFNPRPMFPVISILPAKPEPSLGIQTPKELLQPFLQPLFNPDPFRNNPLFASARQVSSPSAVPLPTSIAFLSSGVFAMLMFRRRKARR
jgi:hypothetical protein